jgi:hypothetical protein
MEYYTISGHSGDINQQNKYTSVPKNVTLVFYAKEGNTCDIMDRLNLTSAIFYMKNNQSQFQISTNGARVPNYIIGLNGSKDIFGLFDKNFTSLGQGIYDLSTILLHISQMNPQNKKTVYAVFCRGDNDEFNNAVAQINSPKYSDLSNFMDGIDFSGGKKRKHKHKRKSNITRRKKKNNKKTKRRYYKKR